MEEQTGEPRLVRTEQQNSKEMLVSTRKKEKK
jgi:hypothetical protein